MDIIDIMLARALTPQGKTEAYVAKANKAAAKAAKAEEDAAAAIATVTAAAEEIAAAQEAANDLLETAQAAQLNMLDVEDIDAEVKKMTVNTAVIDGQNAKTLQVISTYPDNTLNTQNITKLYKSTGNNEDGTMTQKAITDAISTKVDSSTLNSYATKTYVTQQIANIPSGGGGGSIDVTFDTDDAGRLVMIDDNGHLVASDIDADEMISALLQTGLYTLKDAVGLDMDYSAKTMTRIQNATNLNAGTDFDKFAMYGGRMRCNVADDGTINAFYGDTGYTEDGSNGQVMVYQPKFYYQRSPITTGTITNGTAIRHEQLIISEKKQPGFKIAPLFKNGDEELDYVLLSAYEGTVVNDKLASIANSKPVGQLTIVEAEAKATARGTGWHISNLASEAVSQMLEMVEFGSMNGQTSLEAGICNITEVANVNCSSLTGSTAGLGNATGHADSTTNEINGTSTTETAAGKRAISYRGIENPWGNMWHMLGDVIVKGDSHSNGGAVYICTDQTYTPNSLGSNYESIGYNLPSVYGWVNSMGLITNEKYDWVFLPGDCTASANSLLPVGDNLWVTANVAENKILAIGGSYNLQENVGPFYYAADRNVAESARSNYGARLIFIPTKNSIYTTNIEKWTTKMGG